MPEKHFKDTLKIVNQIKIDENTSIEGLINSLKDTGFNAKRLAMVCQIYKEMVEDDECIKFFGLAGALVPAGMRNIIHDFVKNGFIDVLVTTGATLTHDMAETLGYHHLQGDSELRNVDDAKLHEDEINRIYDVFLPNSVYEGIEDFVSQLKIPDNNMSVSAFLKFLGEQISDRSSILNICSEKNIPIFCPAFTDSGLALQLGFHHKNLNLNHFKDMLTMVNLAWDAKKQEFALLVEEFQRTSLCNHYNFVLILPLTQFKLQWIVQNQEDLVELHYKKQYLGEKLMKKRNILQSFLMLQSHFL